MAASIPVGYRELAPPRALADRVECVWSRRVEQDGPAGPGPILPDGRMDLLWTPEGLLVAGPQTRAVPRPLPAPFATVGIRLRPGAGGDVLGLPASELLDAHAALDEVDPRTARLLRGRPAGEALALLARTWQDRVPDPLVLAAVRLLARGARVGQAARAVALGERQLQRRFRVSVGYGPKTLQRVLRFQRVVRGLEDGGELAAYAAAAGYADQPHLTREVRALSGLTPGQLGRLLTGA